MPTVHLAPDPVQSTFLIPGGNTPGVGVQLFCYAAGTTTKQSTYTDNTGNSAHTNPIVLDSGGNIPNAGSVWIPEGQPAKFVWAPANDSDPPSSPYRIIDNVSGINDITAAEWAAGPTPTFVNSSTFTITGDQTGTFKKSRRLKFAVTAGTVYGAVGLAAFGTSTTVNSVFSSGSLDSGLTAVSYSLVDVDPSSINADYIHKKATSVPSGATTNIWGIDGDYVHITGTTGIQSFSSAPYAGSERTLVFDGSIPLVNSGNLLIPGGANVTTALNDRANVRADTTSSMTLTFLTRAVATGRDGGSLVFLSSSNAAGSSNVNFTGLTGFQFYVFRGQNIVPTSSTVNLIARVSSSNGVSFDSGASSYAYALWETNNTGTGSNATSFANHMLIHQGLSANATFGASFVVDGNNFGSSAFNKFINSQSVGVVTGTVIDSQVGGAVCTSTVNPIDGFQFRFLSGNISSGTFYAYGVRGT